jgi:hemerythrin-like domain-containing protein
MSENGSPYADTRDMYKVHATFRREFALLPALVRSAAAEDQERAEIVADHIRLVSLLLHHHHSGEDAVLWPLLLTRALREIDPVVHLMEDQHQTTEDVLTETSALLAAWTGGAASEGGEALAVALDKVAAALFEHMNIEERLVLPLAERHIFASEWQKMVDDGSARIPPEAGPVIAGMLMYEGGLDVAPPELRAPLADRAPRVRGAFRARVRHSHAAAPHRGRREHASRRHYRRS